MNMNALKILGVIALTMGAFQVRATTSDCLKTIIVTESKFSNLSLLESLDTNSELAACVNQSPAFQDTLKLLCKGTGISNRYRARMERQSMLEEAAKRKEPAPQLPEVFVHSAEEAHVALQWVSLVLYECTRMTPPRKK